MSKIHTVYCDDGDVRVVLAESAWDALDRVADAMITAQVTPRPAFREMIDTLRWEEML